MTDGITALVNIWLDWNKANEKAMAGDCESVWESERLQKERIRNIDRIDDGFEEHRKHD